MSISLSAHETQIDLPITVQITVNNAEKHEAPVFPEIPNVLVRSMGPGSTSSQVTIVNGKMTRNESVVYSWQLTPQQAGKFEIPSIEVRADGQSFLTQPQTALVSKSQTSDLLFVELRADKKKVYVGDPLSITLEIWLKPYIDRRYQLDERNMRRTIDVQNSTWGPFASALERKDGVAIRSEFRKDSAGNDHSYFVYQLKQSVWAEQPGQYDPGRISVVVNYPTRLGRSRDPFDLFSNSVGVTASKPISQSAQVAPIEILPIPQEGRPAYYRDAVGQYRLQATAKPTEVSVGDPITLTLTVSGQGRLETLQPPPLADLPDLDQNFKMSDDPAGGVVDGNRKSFTHSIRPKTNTVTQVPPIPFAYFDTRQEKFVTVWSEPIPIKVRPAETLALSQIVDSGGAFAAPTTLRELEGGIFANYTGMDEVLARQDFQPGWPAAAVLSLAPLAFVVCLFTRRHTERLQHDRGFARRRQAYRKAHRALKTISNSHGGNAADRLACAMTEYVADRLDLPSAGLTRAEVIAGLQQKGTDQNLLTRLDSLLQSCEGARYARQDHQPAAELLQLAEHCLEELEGQRLK